MRNGAFSVGFIKALLSMHVLGLFALSMFSPGSPPSFITSGFSEIIVSSTAINQFVQESKFPFATFVAFWFSLGAAPLMAVLTCLARIDVRPLRKMVDGRSVFARFVVAFGAALIMIVFMFVPLAPNSHALWRGEAIGLLMENSRIALFAISSSFFLCFYALWISVVFEISNFLAVIRERV